MINLATDIAKFQRTEIKNTVKIKTDNLNFYYGEKHVLKNINLDIYKNRVTSIIGPSGCGKSTFIRLINRMNDFISGAKAEGKILLDGKNILDKNINVVKLRRKVGMVFQKPNPFPKSIYENVAYGLYVNGQKKGIDTDKRVIESLKHAALFDEVNERLNDSALSLSGGQQQRLCIARCIAVRPEIILFDEPCASLDPISTSKIEELILKLKDDYTIIIVTHNMQQALRISDYTAFFLMGELVEFDETKKIFENPKDKRTEDYITGKFG
ncbi:MAG: phosphate ABC transporter ATP-binding protein [Elusimicrobiales bacterium]|jgi:phosphate transport system ATP-binding protein|nr:phosphate ABC transporter ATP-binding protein [Elusimicrobiales bacterium]